MMAPKMNCARLVCMDKNIQIRKMQEYVKGNQFEGKCEMITLISFTPKIDPRIGACSWS